MQYIDLPHLNTQSSILGFGCSALLGRAGRTESLRALNAAFDAGINFFDTARSYGYGEAESLLGEFLKGKRHSAILSTKFGILPVKSCWWKEAVKPPLRRAVKLIPSTRRLLQNQVKAQFEEGVFTAQSLRHSLEESLRRLNTDYVDIFFAHSAPSAFLDNHEVLSELERAVQSGKVRIAGLSSTPLVINYALRHRPSFLKAFQFPSNVFDGPPDHCLETASANGLIFVANNPFGGAARVLESRRILEALAHKNGIPPSLQHKLTNLDDTTFADITLNSILRGSSVQVVIPAMMNLRHLKSNLAAVGSPRIDQNELLWIRDHWPSLSYPAGVSHSDRSNAAAVTPLEVTD